MRNGHDLKRRRAWSDCEWFLKEGRLWRRHTERVEEVSWTEAEIRRTLAAAGFGGIRIWRDRGRVPQLLSGTETGGRVCFRGAYRCPAQPFAVH